jgi:hypothetical protein
VTGRQRRRRKKLLVDVKKLRECWRLQEEALEEPMDQSKTGTECWRLQEEALEEPVDQSKTGTGCVNR